MWHHCQGWRNEHELGACRTLGARPFQNKAVEKFVRPNDDEDHLKTPHGELNIGVTH